MTKKAIALIVLCLVTVSVSGPKYLVDMGIHEPNQEVMSPAAGLLRLNAGQIQKLTVTGEWKSADSEFREIVKRENLGSYAATAYDSAYFDIEDSVLSICGDYGPDKFDVSENFISSLCKAGRVCEVMGHCWTSLDSTVTYTFREDGKVVHEFSEKTSEEKICRLCGKVQSRQKGSE